MFWVWRVWGQPGGVGPQVWLEVPFVQEITAYGLVPGPQREVGLFFQVTPRLTVGLKGGSVRGAAMMIYSTGTLLFPDVLVWRKMRTAWVGGRYSLWKVRKGILHVEWGVRYMRRGMYGNTRVHLPFVGRRVYSGGMGDVDATWGLMADFPLSRRLRIGGHIKWMFPTFSWEKGYEFWVINGQVVRSYPRTENRLLGTFSRFEWGVVLRAGLGCFRRDPFSRRLGGIGYPELSAWKGGYIEFYRRHRVYDVSEKGTFPRLHRWLFYDMEVFDQVLASRWGPYPMGFHWGIRLGWKDWLIEYYQNGRYWTYWREWDSSTPLVLAYYHGQVITDYIGGGYKAWEGKWGEVMVRGGGMRREGRLTRMVDTAFTPPETAAWALADLGEFGVGGGVRLEFRPLWFGYVYADGGVSHMLWGRMVDYHRTTWTLGVGAGVRIPLGDGKEGEGL